MLKNLVGFESIESSLLTSFQNQKLHHAILLHGKRGIGKASFAKKFVTKILDNPNGANPDLLLIEKEPEKKEITVDKIRKIASFVNQTSAFSPNKFIIIDSACELNKSASNAILKILEEPHKNNFLILISHNLSHVLPTIRSRCYIIKAPDLSLENFSQILRQHNSTISLDELKFLSEICDNSIAEAISKGSELARIYELFLRSILNKKIGEELLKKISDKNFSFIIFEKIYEFFINRLLKFSAGYLPNFYFEEAQVFANLLQQHPLKKLFIISDETLILLRKTIPLYLDKKLTVTNIFNQLI